MLKTFKLSKKNQVTIPKSSRDLLNVKTHNRLVFINNYQNHTVTIKKAPEQHRNFFDRPGLTYKNYKKFCKSQDMSTDNNLVGKEKWDF